MQSLLTDIMRKQLNDSYPLTQYQPILTAAKYLVENNPAIVQAVKLAAQHLTGAF